MRRAQSACPKPASASPERRLPPRPPPRASAEVDLGLEIGARVGARERFLELDPAFPHEIVERTVETEHAALAAGADRFLDADDIALLDELRDVRGVHHHF